MKQGDVAENLVKNVTKGAKPAREHRNLPYLLEW
jgi:hypothetical protein